MKPLLFSAAVLSLLAFAAGGARNSKPALRITLHDSLGIVVQDSRPLEIGYSGSGSTLLSVVLTNTSNQVVDLPIPTICKTLKLHFLNEENLEHGEVLVMRTEYWKSKTATVALKPNEFIAIPIDLNSQLLPFSIPPLEERVCKIKAEFSSNTIEGLDSWIGCVSTEYATATINNNSTTKWSHPMSLFDIFE